MTGKRAAARVKGKGKGKATASAVPDVYRDMLAEALPMQSDIPERPLKRRRVGRPREIATADVGVPDEERHDVDSEEDVEFEDVLGPEISEETADESNSPPKMEQTAYRDLNDSDSESNFDWDTIDFSAKPQEEPSTGDLELTLIARPAPQSKTTAPRRKAVTKEDKAIRLQQHKMHILYLLAFVDRRNEWCNDDAVKASLKPLLTSKMVKFMKPASNLSQFGRGESLKRGLEDVAKMWRVNFKITERGMRRALWADNEKDIQGYRLPEDADSVYEKSDFRAAARNLKGSRDVGAQLYCALLRSAGVKARLVCSLQVLSFAAGGPSMPRSSAPSMRAASPESSDEGKPIDVQAGEFAFGAPGASGSGATPFSARRRLGHPHATDYHLPDMSGPSRPAPPRPKPKTIFESQHPVFWVEVLDVAHQKWFPVDPLVTATISRPQAFEPPASDRDNALSYVVAFDDEGFARDVTRRYTKAYNAKVRKNRVESTHNGEKWWRMALWNFTRGRLTDLEQIENNELAAFEAREPMPRNVADFKDHSYYALERHLRRNEVLVGNHSVGTVAAGRDTGTPGKKKLEHVFRRKDVKIVRTAKAWFELGRSVKMGEQPTKVIAPKPRNNGDEDTEDDRAGSNLYAEEQTDLYQAPPVVNGKVQGKNKWDNLAVYVPTMVPSGGVHILDGEAERAAVILDVDYAKALTGWRWVRAGGRRIGEPVLKGVIVASEYREAVEAVIEGIRDQQAQEEEDRRARVARGLWKRFLFTLRIQARIATYAVEGEERDGGDNDLGAGDAGEMRDSGDDRYDEEDDGEGMESEEYDVDEMGGGFFPE
ncbi:DNA repair rhp41 [Hyphodiscus hymeniophilus]|uniref:DNA repair rhp41 n=1 Tax=Hyphodiscus hymeniophilus TaxID=353542 RepID=A0A9P6VE73_9HELO|nr:DNA repair rhp41 [Hyphodiscus hymeniophilus]